MTQHLVRRAAVAQPWVFDARRPPAGRDGERWAGEATRSAAREPTVDADVIVPLLQSLTCGALIGAPVIGGLVYLVNGPWLVGAGAGLSLAAGCAWWLLLRDHRALLWATERLTHTDLDGDGRAGEPEELRLEVSHRDTAGHLQHVDILRIPNIDGARLRDFAKAVIGGAGLSVHAWTGSNAPFTRAEFDGMLRVLENGGLVARGSGTAGRSLTRAGKAIFARLAA